MKEQSWIKKFLNKITSDEIPNYTDYSQPIATLVRIGPNLQSISILAADKEDLVKQLNNEVLMAILKADW